MSARGFGFDSAIEVTSSVAALWRLWRDPDEARREASERRAMQIIGVCFLLLAAYVLYDAIGALSRREGPGALNGSLRPVLDPVVAARLMLETLVFWAVHRHWDPSPQPVDPRVAQDTVVQMLVGALSNNVHA